MTDGSVKSYHDGIKRFRSGQAASLDLDLPYHLESPAFAPLRCTVFPPSRGACPARASASSAETKATRLAPWTSPPASKLATSMWLRALATFAPGANCATN